MGFSNDLQLIHLGIQKDSNETEKETSGILNHPITSLQLNENRLLVGNLSGHITLLNLNECRDPGELVNEQYLNLKEWANSNSAFIPQLNVKHKSNIRSWCLCARNDAWRLMSGTSSGTVSVWNHRTGMLLYTLDIHNLMLKGNNKLNNSSDNCAFTGVVFDDFYILACGTDGIVRIWEPIA